MHNLFVYGTLKKGYGNNVLLRDAEFLGAAVSRDHYRLLAGGVPFLITDDAAGHPVRGELYAVNDAQLARCDSLEGHPHHYRRFERLFATDDDEVMAWVYLWQNPRWHDADDFLHRAQPDADGVIEWNRDRIRPLTSGEQYDDIEAEANADEARRAFDDD